MKKYPQNQTERLHGRIPTPDGLRVIRAGLDNNPDITEEMDGQFPDGMFRFEKRMK